MKPSLLLLLAVALFALPEDARAQEPEPAGEPEPLPAIPAAPPRLNPVPPEPPTATTVAVEGSPAPEPPTSEGRMLVSAYNSGFQWGIAPGVVFARGKAGFAIGLRLGYGFDLGSVILVPGVRLAGYFIDPNVYLGMPTFKIVLPIDRFAPFIEGGAGAGHVDGSGSVGSKNGAALLGGGGFMIHFRPVAFGAEAAYQTITGTPFRGFSFGPILAIGF